MDWAKAKSILIIVLLIFCLILSGVLVVRNVRAINQLNENKEAALSYLETCGIKVWADVPLKRAKLPVLFVEYSDKNSQPLSYEKYQVFTNSESSAGYGLTAAGEKAAEVMPASSALIEASTRFDPAGLEVNSITLCYYIDNAAPVQNGSQDTAFPAWRIDTNKGVCFVVAF